MTHFRTARGISGILLLGVLFFLLQLNLDISHAQDRETGAETWQGASLTLYKTMALVRDKDSVSLKKGETKQLYHPVSGKIIPESAVITCDNAEVLEQSFVFQPVTPQSILESYLGKDVLLIETDKKTGTEHSIPAKLLSIQNGIVIKVKNRIETTVPGRIAFPEMPKGLGEKPVLKILLMGRSDRKIPVEIAYLTRGISWQADYVAVLDKSESRMRLDGRINIRNNSGITFEKASVQLVAGDVNEGKTPVDVTRNFAMEKSAAPGPMRPHITREKLFEYHLYSIERPVSLEKDQPKEITLFSAAGIPCSKEFLAIGNRPAYTRKISGRGEKIPVLAVVSFKNDKSSGLGIPMPQGKVRMYKRDASGRIQFIGTDGVSHVPLDEEVRLSLGRAFDLVCTRVQTDFKKLAISTKYNTVYESSYEITLKNSKDEPATVKYMEPISGTWKITKENLQHQKPDADTAAWKMDVPAHGQGVLKFTVRVRY